MIRSKQILLSGFLSGGIAVLAFGLLNTFSDLDKALSAEHYSLSEKPRESNQPDSMNLTSGQPSITDFLQIVQRPLFSKTRRPPVQRSININTKAVEPAAPQPETNITKPDVTVMAIIITDDKKIALIENQNKKNDVFRVSEGEKIMGWDVKSIDADKVIIHNLGNEETLKLSDNVLSEAEKRTLALAAKKQPGVTNRTPTRIVTTPKNRRGIGRPAKRPVTPRTRSTSRSPTIK